MLTTADDVRVYVLIYYSKLLGKFQKTQGAMSKRVKFTKRYRQYLLTGDAIPKATLRMRNKRAQERRLKILARAQVGQQSIEVNNVRMHHMDNPGMSTDQSSSLFFHGQTDTPVIAEHCSGKSTQVETYETQSELVQLQNEDSSEEEVMNINGPSCDSDGDIAAEPGSMNIEDITTGPGNDWDIEGHPPINESSLHITNSSQDADCNTVDWDKPAYEVTHDGVASDLGVNSSGVSCEDLGENNDFCVITEDEPGQSDEGCSKSKLCEGVSATVGDLVFMCLALGLKHNMTWNAQVDTLKMVSSIVKNDSIPTNKKAYFNFLNVKEHDISYHVFCSKCQLYLGKRTEERDTNSSITCRTCQKEVRTNESSNYFLYLSLESQLKKMLNDTETAEKLIRHRAERNVKEGEISDIYDGAEYKKHCVEGGILSSPYNFSWMFFTDGISTGRSTGKTMWPLYLSLNELPVSDRLKHTFLGALYVGQSEPNFMMFLKPFVDEATKLASEGFEWTFKGKCITSKVIPLCAVADSVARYQILNMQSFHAYFGCTFCYQEQEKTGILRRRFKFLSQGFKERTDESTFKDALVAYENRFDPIPKNRVHKGVKGPSILMSLKHFDIIWGCPVDYMHAVLLGVVKTHMIYLLDGKNWSFWSGFTDNVASEHIAKIIDERLGKITPPTCLTRVPRSMSMFKLWKASEWRSWIVFYCLPCLDGLLLPCYLAHLAMLSKACNILLQKCVTNALISEAHDLLMNYCKLFEDYFDVTHTLYNVHLLTHICKCVSNWGPLWVYSAFPYEGQNRHLLQLYRSPNNVLLQIVRKFLIYASMPALCDVLVNSEDSLEFVEVLLENRMTRCVVLGKCLLAGKVNRSVLSKEELMCVRNRVGVEQANSRFFKRMLFRGMRFTSTSYATGKQRNDSYISCRNGDILRAQIFCQSSLDAFVVAHKVMLSNHPILRSNTVGRLEFLRKVEGIDGVLRCVNIQEISGQVVEVNCGEALYVCVMPYGCYKD